MLALKPSWSINRVAKECRVTWRMVKSLSAFSEEEEETEEEVEPAPVKTKKKGKQRTVGADGKTYQFKHTTKVKKQPKNGQPTVDLADKQAAWKVYGQLCRALSKVGLDAQLLGEMDAIGKAIKSL